MNLLPETLSHHFRNFKLSARANLLGFIHIYVPWSEFPIIPSLPTIYVYVAPLSEFPIILSNPDYPKTRRLRPRHPHQATSALRGTSLIRNNLPPQDHNRALGMSLL
jgi:hypothetical protein